MAGNPKATNAVRLGLDPTEVPVSEEQQKLCMHTGCVLSIFGIYLTVNVLLNDQPIIVRSPKLYYKELTLLSFVLIKDYGKCVPISAFFEEPFSSTRERT